MGAFCLFCAPHGNDKMIYESKTHREFVNRPLQFNKRSQLFVGAHNKAPSVISMRVCNPDRSPVGINR
jgi:hypothetical protein